jgi:hypothetical protein
MIENNYPSFSLLFASNKGGVSFSTSADTYYRGYTEQDELFQINNDFYRYRYFYSNAYISRLSNESDIIGYYVGDGSTLSEFTNNYGDRDYEKREIELFLTIYQQTRDYYYRVLLNKSFIQEGDYKLYEKLFISFFAIERFLNSKIENIHDPDYFNSTDIYNFLESYGLGVLNDEKYNFILGERDYKLNIVKLFNELVKLKGSRDVISVLLRVFEVGDFEAEIRKFLIYEETDYNNGIKDSEGTIKFIEVPYFSDNGSREIFAARPSAVNYRDFLRDDIYWDADEVTEEALLDIGLDVSETKYLSLTLSENIYKKYTLSRYVMSTIDYLQSNLLKGTDPVLCDTKLDAGELFGTVATEISIGSYFEAIKVIYKAILKLYGIDSNIASIGEINTGLFYGINESSNWASSIDSLLNSYISDYSNIDDEFNISWRATDINGAAAVPASFNKYNVYKEASDWINYDNRIEGNLNIFYKKYNYAQKTEVAKQLENSLFSTHKTSYGKQDVANEYQNSGSYILETFDNLNLLRIDNTNNDLWLHILGQYWNDNYDLPTSSTYDPTGSNINYRDLYYFAIEKIMKFPVDYFDGLLSPYRNPELYHNEAFIDFANNIFQNIYITDNNPIYIDTSAYIPPADLALSTGNYLDEALSIIDGTYADGIPESGSDAMRELILEYTEKLLVLIDGLQSLFSSEAYMQWSLSLKDQEEATLQFVQTSVEIFLSYTTELYYTTYKKKYDSISEITPLAERVEHRLESTKMDMVFYDEKLNIELTEGDE